MRSARRKGIESSEVRAQLVEAAARIVRDEGLHAVTTRRIAETVGLTRYTVHYYFGTMDDLLIAVLHQEGERMGAEITAALETTDPLQVIWELGPNAAPQTMEFIALAMRRPAIREAIAVYQERFHRQFAQALTLDLERRGIVTRVPVGALVAMIQSLSEWMATAEALDFDSERAAVRTAVDTWLSAYASRGELPVSMPIPEPIAHVK